MTLPSSLRHVLACAGLGFALAAATVPALAATGSTAKPAPVHGLIVQLHNAPSHVTLARERALTQSGSALPREAARWQRLVAELRSDSAVLGELPDWVHAAPQRDPVGASAQLLRFARPLTAEQAERVAARLAASPEVAWVAANSRERRQAIAGNAPNDRYFAGANGQWWLHPVQGSNANAIEARLRGVPGFLSAWQSSTTGNAAAVVAVLDTGITCHPDLGNLTADCIGGAILPGYDFVADSRYANDGDGRDADPRDPGDWVSQADRNADPARFGDCEVESSSWHGSVIAGIVAAQTDNGIGAAAVNWNGRVLPVRVAGKCGADVADIVDGMRWAAGLTVCKRSDRAGGCAEFVPANRNPARIVNISFGGSAACSPAYQQAIDELRAAPGGGALVVAAAGNAWGTPSRPASCQRVIGVGALNRDGFKTNYSNFGAVLAISTVGGDDGDGTWGAWLADSGVLSIGNSAATVPADCTLPGANCYFYHYGTSFSAPIVAGTVSLMLSVNPTLSVSQIEQGLARSARPHVTSSVSGFGICSDSNTGRCLCTTSTCGAGILDATQALYYAADPAGYVNLRSADVIDTLELRAAVASGQDRPANSTPAPAVAGAGGGAMGSAWLFALSVATLALCGQVSALARLAQALRRLRTRHRTRRR
ncbi:MAG: S8 family peptidase [Burkholderiaceae bacterium]|nr:S8 family peptidase [Burkholderiaceae bacterium]